MKKWEDFENVPEFGKNWEISEKLGRFSAQNTWILFLISMLDLRQKAVDFSCLPMHD